ncbi:MAG: ABC transporter ATP-binding protein [Flavobacteriaceae bacterium]|nr:ABC transporter ATP-binding protein/permease [Bacteroidia bacterium]NNF74897.1 ABC transporter ATP-binding protein [Flavobacteriaceae bacterium]
MKELRYLNKYFAKYKTRLILGILITIGAKIFALFTPRLIGRSVDIVEKGYKQQISAEVFRSELILNISYLLGAALIAGAFTFLMRQTIINVSRFVEFDLKNEIYEQYQRLSLGFYKANRTGDLMSRISEDVGKVRMYFGPAIMYSMNMITLFIVALIYMFNQAPVLTLYTVIPLPVLSVAIYFLSKAIHEKSTIVQQYLAKLSTFTQESFSGISVIKAYNIEGPTNSAFETLSEEQRQKQIDLAKIRALFFPLMILLIGVSNLIVIYVGGKQYINGQIDSIGTIAEFIIYVNMLTWPVTAIGWVTSLVQEAEASQKRINEFLKEDPEIKDLSSEITPIEGHIEFRNVSFTYPDTNITALNGLSFKLRKGETLAIIGKTGSGKSTVLDLIGRLYDIEKGKILVDGKPIKELHLKTLRESIGYVPQDAFLFSESIKENIKFGLLDASEEDVIQAAKRAEVHENIINFNDGYNTILGERGITLSGGQKQRVSIARAIIKNPNILLLDDCLSAVDTETEENILNNLEEVTLGKTTIIVSHRISSVKNADQIIVLDHGKVIQKGKHEQLINIDGYYQELYKKQLSEKEIS